MKFSEFAQKAYPAIGKGANKHAFAKTLFDAIVDDVGREILDEYSDESFKSYYNGSVSISKLAKKLSSNIEPAEFVGYLDDMPDQSIQKMCDTFAENIDNISPHNATELLAGFFADIIYEAAGEKRKTYGSKTADYAESNFTGETTQECPKKSLTLVQQQNNVIMNGENNLNLTNHGTMNFNFGGD